MQSNELINNQLYDTFFLENTFNSVALLKSGNAEAKWLSDKLNIDESFKILDVGCGTGRHSAYFSQVTPNTYAVDMSADCVLLAKENCPLIQDQIYNCDFKDYYKQNISKMKFNLVFSAGATIGYSSDKNENVNYLKMLVDFVSPVNGFLVLSYLNKHWAYTKFATDVSFNSEKEDFFVTDERQIKNNYLISTKTFKSKSNDSDVRKYQDKVYLYDKDELIQFVQELNPKLKFDSIYQSFSNSEYDETSSPLPVLIFKT